MGHHKGAGSDWADRVTFDCHVRAIAILFTHIVVTGSMVRAISDAIQSLRAPT